METPREVRIHHYIPPASAYGLGYEPDPLKKERVLKEQERQRRKKKYEVKQSGIDDGQEAQKVLFSYVDEVLRREDAPLQTTYLTPQLTDDFLQSSFIQKLNHPQFSSIPLLSQVAKERAKIPSHSTEKRRLFLSICNRLRRNDGLMVRARLEGFGIDDQLMGQLSSAVKRNIYLQHLLLHGNAISDESLAEFAACCRWHPSLHTVWLGANRVTDVGVKHLCDLVRLNQNIKILNISNKWPNELGSWSGLEHQMHPHITYVGAELFARQFSRCCGLTSLCLADQRIRDTGAIAIYRALAPSSVRTLNFKGNELTDVSCRVLGVVLSQNPKLEKLDISRNEIGDEGACAVASGIAMNSKLQALNLAYNLIEQTGLEALTRSMESNFVLKTLLTIYNKSSDASAEYVAQLRRDAADSYFSHQFRAPDDARSPMTAQQELAVRREINESFWEDEGFLTDETAAALAATVAASSRPSSGAGADPGGSRPSSGPRNFKALPAPWSGGESVLNKRTPSADVGLYGMRPLSRSMTFSPDSTSIAARGRSRPAAGVGLGDMLPSRPSSTGTGNIAPRASGKREGLATPGTPGGSSVLPALWEDSLFSGADPTRTSRSRAPSADGSLASERSVSSRGSSRGSSRAGSRARSQGRLSSELGKTLGVPKIPSMGTLPVRSATSPHRDSGQQLAYLRVSTPDDPPDARPYSLIEIESDRRAYRKMVEAQRQLPKYKEDKANKIRYGPKYLFTKGSMKPPPDDFWEYWDRVMRHRYPHGIDNATGTESTRIGFGKRVAKEEEEEQKRFESFQKGLEDARSGVGKAHQTVSAAKNQMSPGKALVIRRKMTKLKKDMTARDALRKQEQEAELLARDPSKRQIRDLLGLKQNETFSNVLDQKGALTLKTSKQS